MKITTTLVVLEKDTGFGYIESVHLSQDTTEKGGSSYYYRVVERWKDGHETFGKFSRIPNAAYLNDMYVRRLREGYELVSRETFVQTEMDMR